MRAGPLIANPQEAWLEEVAPQNVRSAVGIDIEDRQRVRAVQRWLALPDDLDVFEFLGDQLKPRRPLRIEPLHLVARDRPVHATEHHVELAVAIDVGELRDVLAVGVNRDTLHIPQRVGEGDETRGRARADVAVVADVAERRFREQVDEPIAVHIHEPVPLADVDALIAAGR